MRVMKLGGCALIVAVLTACVAHADDPCLGDEEKNAALGRSAALQKAEQAGQPAALFVVYMQIVADECMDRYDKNAVMKTKVNMPKLGRDLAKAAEAKGALYSSDPIRGDAQTAAFRYYELSEIIRKPTVFCLRPFRSNQKTCVFSRRLGTSITDDTVRSSPPPDQDNPIILRQHSGKN
jgi:hypothetical protein